MPRSHLEIVTGIYVPGRRFAFTNTDDEDFVSQWNRIPITVKAGETIEISDITPIPSPSMGHCLAVKMTMELTDKIIMKAAKLDEMSKNTMYYRSPIAFHLNVANQRKVYEDKILRQLAVDEESPAMTFMREKLKAEILAGGQVEQAPPPLEQSLPSADFRAAVTQNKSLDGFSEIGRNNSQIPEAPKEPAKTKRMGRPPKVKHEDTDSTGK